MSDSKKKALVAYSSRDPSIATVIMDAVRRANPKSPHVRYEPWQLNDVTGKSLASSILSQIEHSEFVVADITTLNLNVVYEIGFSIGIRKRVFLIRNRTIVGDQAIEKEAGIFDTLGFSAYDSEDSLCDILSGHISSDPITFPIALDRLAPVYVVESSIKDHVATTMISRLKKARYRYRSFNPGEDVRLSALDAIRQVSVSAGILVSLRCEKVNDDQVHNVRALFVAGLAHGMRKPTLILCANDYRAPVDILDDVKQFKYPDDIASHINKFSLEITDHLQSTVSVRIDTGTLLQSLQIGDPTAENEMATLASYYLPLNQYDRAVNGQVNLVVGRKGSGKTALFIQVRDRIREQKRNIVVDLKPEGYQLIKLKEEMLEYLTDGARHHLITAFWEYLLLLEVAYKLLEKDRNTYSHNHDIYDLYLRLNRTYQVEDFSSDGDFSERLLTLSQRISAVYRQKFGAQLGQKLSTKDVSELVYSHDVRELRQQISEYLERKRSVWVLFDNLDKGWTTHGIDVIDAVILRCLIDAGRKLERDMRKQNHQFRCIIFIRNDVYEHLMLNSADFGKEMRSVLDWTDPDLLREMLRRRLLYGRDKIGNDLPFDQLWPAICVSHYQGDETLSYMIDRSLMRPRNLLKIFNHCRGFANNFNRQKIIEDDIEKGMLAYSHDLVIELDRELVDVFPVAQQILYCFIDVPSIMPLIELEQYIEGAGIKKDEVTKVVEFLLYYGIIGLHATDKDYYIYDVNYGIRSTNRVVDQIVCVLFFRDI